MVSYPNSDRVLTPSEELRELAEKLVISLESLRSELSQLALEHIIVSAQHQSLLGAVKEAFSENYFDEQVQQYRINSESFSLNPKLEALRKVISK